MFKSILIKNSFLQRDLYIEFEKGLNILAGKNGCGKSTVLEYLSYSLYGANALRSPVKDFPQGFTVETEFEISEINYKVIRTIKSSSLYEFSNNKYVEIVKGTTPVNTKIKELLGYDYSIFILINFIKQHDLLSLTQSTPAQLLSLIELISGLSGSYKLEEQLKQRRKETKIEEDALKLSIDVALKDMDEIFVENEDFEALISQHEDPSVYIRETLKNYLDSIDTLNKQIYDLETKNSTLNNFQDTIKSLEYLDENSLEQYQKDYNFILKIESDKDKLETIISQVTVPEKEYSLEYLEQQESLLSTYDKYLQEQKLKLSLEKHKIECPNCNHSFYNTSKNINFEFEEEPEKPVLDINQIYAGKNWLNTSINYKQNLENLSQFEDILKSLNKEQIKTNLDEVKQLLEVKELYSNLYQEILNLDYFDKDKSIEINIANLINQKEQYQKDYEELDNLKIEFLNYLNKKIEFEKKEEVRKNFGIKIEQLQTNKRVYSVLLDTLKKVKSNIQTTILPKLNYTSSQLLSQVTNGERNKIEITDDFKLFVDNQVVNTLEGSAQVLTNIALRCSFLTTFYSDNFLVSLQDEPDAPLAVERFEALVEAYKKLEEQNFQLIIISHKDYDYGNIINLEDISYNI